MTLRIFQVDAFASRIFKGNPAAVVPLTEWLDDESLQAIAQENNLAETAFFKRVNDSYELRWFTPTSEVDLCGHATLASAHVLYTHLRYQGEHVLFHTRSGDLIIKKQDSRYIMDFPAQPPTACDLPDAIKQGLAIDTSVGPIECWQSEDYIVVVDSRETVLSFTPDMLALSKADLRGVIVTARAEEVDFVARFFGPKVGVPEDSVTGSAYTQLAPLWASKLNQHSFTAKQVAKRGGELTCELVGERVFIGGNAKTYLIGDISLD